MSDVKIQVPSVIMPLVAVQAVGTLVEAVDDILEHTSEEFIIVYLQEKQIHITVTEVIAAGVPGNLLCWVELSPVPSTVSAAYWAAIGGGGGGIAPTAPHIEVGTGVNGTVHSIILPWAIHSVYARLVVQTPVLVATAAWTVQGVVSAKQ